MRLTANTQSGAQTFFSPPRKKPVWLGVQAGMQKHEARQLAAQAIQAALSHGLLDHWRDECLVFGAPGLYSESIVIGALKELTEGGQHRTLYIQDGGVLARAPRTVVEHWATTTVPSDGTRGLVIVFDDGDETVITTSSWLPVTSSQGERGQA